MITHTHTCTRTRTHTPPSSVFHFRAACTSSSRPRKKAAPCCASARPLTESPASDAALLPRRYLRRRRRPHGVNSTLINNAGLETVHFVDAKLRGLTQRNALRLPLVNGSAAGGSSPAQEAAAARVIQQRDFSTAHQAIQRTRPALTALWQRPSQTPAPLLRTASTDTLQPVITTRPVSSQRFLLPLL